jgi:HK97 family phage major capsid protein
MKSQWGDPALTRVLGNTWRRIDDRHDSLKARVDQMESSFEELRGGAKSGRLADWELKNGFVWAPDRRAGVLFPVWSAVDLYGPAPDTASARFIKAVRTICQPGYEMAFMNWLGNVAKHGPIDAFASLSAFEQKSLGEGLDQSGGFLVPAELSVEILTVIRERSKVRQGAKVIPTSRDRLEIGELDFAAEWVPEVPAAGSETSIAPIKQVGVEVWKVRAKARVSRDLFTDQGALRAWLVDASGQALSLKEDQAFVAGDGILKPLGFINGLPSTSIKDLEGSTVDTVSNTSAAAGSRPKLEALEADLPDAFRANSRWFMAGATLAKIRGLVTPGNTMAFPDAVHPQTGESLLMSHPVSTSSAMPLDGANGNIVLGLVDLSRYIVATRSLLSARLDLETFADTDQIGMVLFDRIGGVLGTADAVRVGQV